jgi:hypothetical protein
MTYSQLDAMLAESGFDPDDVDHLTTVLGPLSELADEAPAPTAELLALMGEPSEGATVHALPRLAPAKRSRGMLAGAVVLALSGVGATGLSAAANTLPSPWQHQVSDFSHHYLPFDFPEPTVQLPHLAPAPRGPKASDPPDAGRIAELLTQARPAGAGDELSRSLAQARSVTRGARPLSARHSGEMDSDDESTAASEPTSRPTASGSPSATPSGSSSTGATPSDGPRPVKPAASAPVKSYAPARPAPVAGPRDPGAPRGGKYDLQTPAALPLKGPVKSPVKGPVGGPLVLDPGTGVGEPAPGDLPVSPKEASSGTGTVPDAPGPDAGSTSHGDAPNS